MSGILLVQVQGNSMKRLFVVLVLLPLLTACGSNVILSSDFENSDDDILAQLQTTDTVIGIADDGYLRVLNTNQGRGQSGYVTVNADVESDYSLEANLRVIRGEAQLWLRADADLCSGYVFSLDPTLNAYRLGAVDDECNLRTVRDRILADLPFNEWTTLHIEAEGKTIRGLVGDVEYFSFEDERYSTGLPLIRLVNEGTRTAQIEIDDLRVR